MRKCLYFTMYFNIAHSSPKASLVGLILSTLMQMHISTWMNSDTRQKKMMPGKWNVKWSVNVIYLNLPLLLFPHPSHYSAKAKQQQYTAGIFLNLKGSIIISTFWWLFFFLNSSTALSYFLVVRQLQFWRAVVTCCLEGISCMSRLIPGCMQVSTVYVMRNQSSICIRKWFNSNFTASMV